MVEPEQPPSAPRPLIERIGLFGIAAVFTALFAGLAVAAWAGGEPVLTVLGGIGAFMTAWVGLLTLLRG